MAPVANLCPPTTMPTFKLRPADTCQFDLLALGEIMLRLDPGEGRIRTAREFTVWEGGGEYNVARGLRRCFGLKTAVATAFADNDVGRLLEDFVLQGGVATDFVKWMPFDGVGRVTRNKFLLRLEVDGYQLTVFPDGRAIIGGTDDIATARTMHAKYIGS